MKEKSVGVIRGIAKIALLLCVISLLGIAGYYTYRSIKFKPYKVRVSNVTDSAFTVSWITDEPMVGIVYYGEKDNFLPGPLSWIGKQKAVDDRDYSNAQTECVSEFNKKASKNRDDNFTIDISDYDCNDVKVFKKGEYYTHHVTVQNLESEKEYFFRVGNGILSYAKGKTEGVGYIEREMPSISELRQKTLPIIKDLSTPNPAYGTSFNFYRKSDGFIGMKNNFDSIIFLKTFKDGDEYPLMSAVTNSDGGWSIDLSNVRDRENNILSLEGSSFEFIPQVDNARPGANGVMKYEDVNFPLRILGNKSDDWGESVNKAEEVSIQARRLLDGLVSKSYAATCLCQMGTTCKTMNDFVCTDNGGKCVSSCSTTPPAQAPAPQPDWINCWSFVNKKCVETSVKRFKCDGGYFVTESACCTQNDCGQEKTCYRCVQGKLSSRVTKGNCYSDESTTKPNCSVPKTCYWCSQGELKSRTITTGECKSVESKTPLTCKEEVNCFCGANSCKNAVSKDGKSCKASEGCYAKKVDCLDKNLGGGEGKKTCCRIDIKGGCSCLENQKQCTGLYKEYSSENDCKDAKVTVIGEPITAETGCVDGRTVPSYVPVRVTGIKNQSIVQRRGILDILRPKAFAQPMGDNWESVCESDDNYKSCYTYYDNSAKSCRTCEEDTGDCNLCTSDENCPDGEMSCPEEKTQLVDESTTSNCTKLGKDNCKEYWRHTDCAVIYSTSNPGDGYTDKRAECKGTNLKLPDGAANQQLLSNNCIVKIGDEKYETAPNMDRIIVSGGCNSCYAEYRNKSTGVLCANVKVQDVFCGNPAGELGCDNQRVQVGECGKKCKMGVCVCPSNCANGGRTVTGEQVCGTEVGQENIEGDGEQSDGEESDGVESVNICRYHKNSRTNIHRLYETFQYMSGTQHYEKWIEEGQLKDCSSGVYHTGSLTNYLSCYSKTPCNALITIEPEEPEESGEGEEVPNAESLSNSGEELFCCKCSKKEEAESTWYRTYYDLSYSSFEFEAGSTSSCSKDGYTCTLSSLSAGSICTSAELLLNEDLSYYTDETDKGYGMFNVGGFYCCVNPDGSNLTISDSPCNSSSQQRVDWEENCEQFSRAFISCLDDNKVFRYSYIKKSSKEPDCPRGEKLSSGENFYCYNSGASKTPLTNQGPRKSKSYCLKYAGEIETSNTDGHLEIKRKLISPSFANSSVGGSSVIFFPETGLYQLQVGDAEKVNHIALEGEEMLAYIERNGIPGFQSPKDLANPLDNEDLLLNSSAVIMSVEQIATAKQYELKKGVNIISFDLFPSEGEQVQLTSNRFLELVNQSGYKVSRISYFGGGQWDGGNIYDFKSGEVKGAPFSLTQGKGYVIVAEKDTTITVPGYNIESSVPIAFSSGWNLIGVHGHDTQYTANSFINSINSIEGLKSNNVTYWPTSKGMYQGYQLSEGQSYGQDFSISPNLGYFVRINEFTPKTDSCKSLIWNPGGSLNGECGTN